MATPAAPEHIFAAAQNAWNQNGSSAVSRSRRYYCGLHGWNNSHHSPQCRVMADDDTYPASLRVATTHVGTGGNPKVGPPVSFNRPPPFSFVPSPLSSNISPPISISPPSSARACTTPPYEDTSLQPSPALPSIKSEGQKSRRVRVLAANPISLLPSVSWLLSSSP
jgi:hypothetical protein